MNNKGFIFLTNRPLTLRLQTFENEGIPVTITRGTTYSSVEPYLSLTFWNVMTAVSTVSQILFTI